MFQLQRTLLLEDDRRYHNQTSTEAADPYHNSGDPLAQLSTLDRDEISALGISRSEWLSDLLRACSAQQPALQPKDIPQDSSGLAGTAIAYRLQIKPSKPAWNTSCTAQVHGGTPSTLRELERDKPIRSPVPLYDLTRDRKSRSQPANPFQIDHESPGFPGMRTI